MSHYVGLDVSLKEVSVCVVDAEGTVLHRACVPTEPDTIAEYISQKAPNVERVVHESRILATWLTRELARLGVPITCIDMRDECLNEHLFDSLHHARSLVATWRIDFNLHRPHSSLAGLTPAQYVNRSKEDQNLNRANPK